MSDQSEFNDELLKDKLEILLDEDNEIKKWNEGLLIKSLILLPIIIFIDARKYKHEMAERGRFELPVGLRLHMLSKHAP